MIGATELYNSAASSFDSFAKSSGMGLFLGKTVQVVTDLTNKVAGFSGIAAFPLAITAVWGSLNRKEDDIALSNRLREVAKDAYRFREDGEDDIKIFPEHVKVLDDYKKELEHKRDSYAKKTNERKVSSLRGWGKLLLNLMPAILVPQASIAARAGALATGVITSYMANKWDCSGNQRMADKLQKEIDNLEAYLKPMKAEGGESKVLIMKAQGVGNVFKNVNKEPTVDVARRSKTKKASISDKINEVVRLVGDINSQAGVSNGLKGTKVELKFY